MQPLRLLIVSRAFKRTSIFLIFDDLNGRYDLEKKGVSLLMSKIVNIQKGYFVLFSIIFLEYKNNISQAFENFVSERHQPTLTAT